MKSNEFVVCACRRIPLRNISYYVTSRICNARIGRHYESEISKECA